MPKIRKYDEMISEMIECYSKLFDVNISLDTNNLFFINEFGVSRECEDGHTKLYINKLELLNYGQFRLKYRVFCDEKRWELKLVLLTDKKPYVISYEVSERKDNPYGLVNVAYPLAIPDESYELIIN